jgi:hypothetical protein
VQQVMRGDDVLVAETLPRTDLPRILPPAQAADLTYALTWIGPTTPNATVATKTGIWDYDLDAAWPTHAWSVGYISNLAIAVHIGNRSDVEPLIDRTGASVLGSVLPNTIMRRVLSPAP